MFAALLMMASIASNAEKVSEVLSLPERCVAKVVVKEGRPRLEINGAPAVENFFVTNAVTGSLDVLPDLAKAGYQVVGIPYYPAKCPRGGSRPVWIGERLYDWKPLDDKFAQIRAMAPAIRVILYLHLDAPAFWLKSHPGEVVVHEDGKPGLDESSFITTMGGASFVSEPYLQDVEHLLRAMIAHIDTQPYRDMFMGIHLVGGADAQWFDWGIKRGKISDFSKPMRTYFSNFLRQKYGNDASRLQGAWGQPGVSFETAAIPGSQRRLGTGDFRDPAQEQDAIDYISAVSDAKVALISRFARTVKTASERRAWVGVYSGAILLEPSRYSQVFGYLFEGKLLKCPDIDGVSAVTYYQRPLNQPGALGLITGSCRLHGKLAIHEQDIRTYLAKTPQDRKDPRQGFTPNWEQQRNMLIREFGLVLANGIATWQFDLHGPWYSAPEFWDLFSKFNQIRAAEEKRPFASVAEMAVVVDDNSEVFRPQDDRFLRYNSNSLQRTPLGWMGAPYDVYLLDDLLNNSTPDFKCYMFMNCYRVDSKARKQIHERLRRNGATAVWIYASGIYSDDTFDIANIERLTGFGVARVSAESPLAVVKDGGHPIVKGLAPMTYGIPDLAGTMAPPLFNGKTFYCPQEREGVTVLSTLESTTSPSLAIRKMDGWTSIYSASPLLNAKLLRNILRQAGGFLYTDDAETTVCANRNVLSLFAKTDGVRTVRLPQASRLRDLLTGESLGTGNQFTIPLKASEARIFAIEPK